MRGYLLVLGMFLVVIAAADERLEFTFEIKNHLFYPSELVVPAGQKIKLHIVNHDDTPEEFDSFDLNREKVIFPNGSAIIYVGPLSAGVYEFFGEYNPNSATGRVIVKVVRENYVN